MSWPEKFSPPEQKEASNDIKTTDEKPFNPVEQRLEWSIALVSDEYKTKLWKDLPDEIKNLLSEALKWKDSSERDMILDVLIDMAQNWEEIDSDMTEYLEEVVWEQSEKSNEQEEIVRNESKLHANEAELGMNKAEELEKAKLLKRREDALKLKNSLQSLDWNWKEYQLVLNKINSLEFSSTKNEAQDEAFDKQVTEILKELDKPEVLTAVYLDLRDKSPQALADFQAAVISLAPEFEPKFLKLETQLKLALWTDNLENAKITKDRISVNSPDWYTTDSKLDWTDRTLKRRGSQFEVKSKLPNDRQVQTEADMIADEANKLIEPLNSTLQNLTTLKKYLESLSATTPNLDEVKAEIKAFSPELYGELWLENSSSVTDISSRLDAHIAKISAQRDEIRKSAKETLDKLAVAHKQELAEKQKYQKQALDVLATNWLGFLEQSDTTLLFDNININYAKYWFTREIDFENASLGFDFDTWNRNINEQEKKNFYEATNRMTTWNPNYPIWYERGVLVYYASEGDAENKIPAGANFNIEEFVKTRLWASPAITARNNLEESVKNFWKIWEKKEQGDKKSNERWWVNW